MLKRRLIFTLLIQNGYYMLSRNFSLQKVGDLNWIKNFYNFNAISSSIDELIVLNVNRNEKNMLPFSKCIIELTENCFMPIATGGGIRSLEDAYLLLDSGADKLILNTPLIENEALVRVLVETFGSQCVVASFDYKKTDQGNEIFTQNGSKNTGISLIEGINRAQELGIGELYLTSISHDGTGQGYDISTLAQAVKHCAVPVIASGGVGKFEHFVQGITEAGVQAVSTANLFNFIANG